MGISVSGFETNQAADSTRRPTPDARRRELSHPASAPFPIDTPRSPCWTISLYNVTREIPDITARLPQPGGRDVTVVIDDDGYIELRFWASPGTTPSQITTTLTRAIGVITG